VPFLVNQSLPNAIKQVGSFSVLCMQTSVSYCLLGDYDVDLNGQHYSNMLAEAAGLNQLPQLCSGSR
jgi:hypothetical protein